MDACYVAWLERAKSHPGNIAVFYFCGHGIAGSSDYILPSDFGTHRTNPWSDAIDITETACAARREVSGSLYFLIDACRQASRDSLMPGASPPALQYVDFDRRVLCFTRMLLWATGEDTQRLTEAEAAYQEALDIRRKLAVANPAAYWPDLAGTMHSFGLLYSATQRPTEAATAYREALDIYRKLAETNPTVYAPVVTHILDALAALGPDNELPV